MNKIKKVVLVGLVLLIGVFFLGRGSVSLSSKNELDKAWLEAGLAWTESSIAQYEENIDYSAEREFESALELIRDKELSLAYDRYVQAFYDYMYSDTPEKEWEREWKKVEGETINFQKAYASALRRHLERYHSSWI